MCIERIYPNLQKEGLIPLQNIPNEEPFGLIYNENQAFKKYKKVDTADNISNKFEQNEHNSLDDTSKLLQQRKVDNTTRRENILQLLKKNKTMAAIYFFLLVIFTIGSVVGTPLLAIGVALNAILLALIIAYSTAKVLDYNNIALQNMGIEILLAVLKDNIPTTHISPEDNTKLVSILENTISSISSLTVIDIIIQCKKLKNTKNGSFPLATEESPLKARLEEFSNNIFNNPDLTEHLHKLGFNVKAVKKGAYSYIENVTIDQINNTI
jgi:hypothetical protein